MVSNRHRRLDLRLFLRFTLACRRPSVGKSHQRRSDSLPENGSQKACAGIDACQSEKRSAGASGFRHLPPFDLSLSSVDVSAGTDGKGDHSGLVRHAYGKEAGKDMFACHMAMLDAFDQVKSNLTGMFSRPNSTSEELFAVPGLAERCESLLRSAERKTQNPRYLKNLQRERRLYENLKKPEFPRCMKLFPCALPSRCKINGKCIARQKRRIHLLHSE